MTIRYQKSLMLWRHSESQDVKLVDEDFNRALTKKGQYHALVMASWLKQHLSTETYIISSPSLRAEQTVQALGLPYQLNKSLLPQATVEEVLQLVQKTFYQNKTNDILLVGHQPWLGQVAAYFLQINTAELSIKKSAVWWLAQHLKHQKLENEETDDRFKLVSVQSPQFILN